MIDAPLQWPPVVWLWLAGALSFLALAIWSRRSPLPEAASFRGLALATVIFVGCSALELVTRDDTLWYWESGVMYLGIGLLSPFIVLLFADVTGHGDWFSPRRRRWMIWGCLAVGALRFADPWCGLVFQSAEPVFVDGLRTLRFAPGPVFVLLQAMLVAAALVGIIMVWHTWHEAGRLLQRNMRLLLIACLFPVVTNLAFVLGFNPWGPFDPTPFGTLATLSVTAWAIFRNRLVRISPIPHNRLLENLRDGILVTDNQRAVVEINPAAERLLHLDESAGLGQPLDRLLADWPVLTALCASNEETRSEIPPATEGGCFWGASWHPVFQGNTTTRIGFMLVVSDITPRKRAEQQLRTLLATRTRDWHQATAAALRASEEEQSRLGNLLHDTLCQDLVGFRRTAETLALQLPAASRSLNTLADQIADASRRARDLAHILAGPNLEHHSFEEALGATTTHLERSLSLSCDLTLAPAFPVPSAERAGHLIRIIREAVVNAARHANARRVWIDLLGSPASGATVTIANDGTPPPADRREGLGWRQMHMRASLLGGSISLAPGPANGAIVELRLPASTP